MSSVTMFSVLHDLGLKSVRDLPDLYSFFEVKTQATNAEIQDAFKKVVLASHPDKNGGGEGTLDMTKVKTYRMILQNATLRRYYDLHKNVGGGGGGGDHAAFRRSDSAPSRFRANSMPAASASTAYRKDPAHATSTASSDANSGSNGGGSSSNNSNSGGDETKRSLLERLAELERRQARARRNATPTSGGTSAGATPGTGSSGSAGNGGGGGSNKNSKSNHHHRDGKSSEPAASSPPKAKGFDERTTAAATAAEASAAAASAWESARAGRTRAASVAAAFASQMNTDGSGSPMADPASDKATPAKDGATPQRGTKLNTSFEAEFHRVMGRRFGSQSGGSTVDDDSKPPTSASKSSGAMPAPISEYNSSPRPTSTSPQTSVKSPVSMQPGFGRDLPENASPTKKPSGSDSEYANMHSKSAGRTFLSRRHSVDVSTARNSDGDSNQDDTMAESMFATRSPRPYGNAAATATTATADVTSKTSSDHNGSGNLKSTAKASQDGTPTPRKSAVESAAAAGAAAAAAMATARPTTAPSPVKPATSTGGDRKSGKSDTKNDDDAPPSSRASTSGEAATQELPLVQLETLLSRISDACLRSEILEIVRSQDRQLFQEQLAWQKATQRARAAEARVFDLGCRLRESQSETVRLREQVRRYEVEKGLNLSMDAGTNNNDRSNNAGSDGTDFNVESATGHGIDT